MAVSQPNSIRFEGASTTGLLFFSGSNSRDFDSAVSSQCKLLNDDYFFNISRANFHISIIVISSKLKEGMISSFIAHSLIKNLEYIQFLTEWQSLGTNKGKIEKLLTLSLSISKIVNLVKVQ